MVGWQSISDIRRDYGTSTLDEKNVCDNPINQFKLWFQEVLALSKEDPTAMVLSTIDEQGYPDSRVVLLKDIDQDTFVFYSNYDSKKAQQLKQQPYAALNFYWPEMARQVRIRGFVQKTTPRQSDDYFATRPIMSQLSAMASPQSQVIPNRDVLETAFHKLANSYQQQPVPRPLNWGGYFLEPNDIEFWQGRDNRLHDRLSYVKKNNLWLCQRLAP